MITLKSLININEAWYHGTPDAREIEKEGGFNNKTINITYISDLDKFNKLRSKLQHARDNDDMNSYMQCYVSASY